MRSRSSPSADSVRRAKELPPVIPFHPIFGNMLVERVFMRVSPVCIALLRLPLTPAVTVIFSFSGKPISW